MPGIVFHERPLSQPSTGNDPTIRYNYVCYGTVDTNEVQATALLFTPPAVSSTYGILYRQDVIVDPEGNDQWGVTVPYGKVNKVVGSFTLSFDTTGGTVNRKVSIATTNSYKATGEPDDPPDYKGAIDVQDDGQVNGADVVIPALKLNAHFKHPVAVITLPQIRAIARMAGTVNSATFLGFEAGEVLFLGATGSEGTDSETEVTYQFACSENLVDGTIGPFTHINKGGWDYVWVKFHPDVDGGNPIIKPRWIFMEQVYFRKNFAAILGFGG